MLGYKVQTASVETPIPATPFYFGAIQDPGKSGTHGHMNGRVSTRTADAENSEANAFFRAHPDVFLAGLLFETAAAFGNTAPD